MKYVKELGFLNIVLFNDSPKTTFRQVKKLIKTLKI